MDGSTVANTIYNGHKDYRQSLVYKDSPVDLLFLLTAT